MKLIIDSQINVPNNISVLLIDVLLFKRDETMEVVRVLDECVDLALLGGGKHEIEPKDLEFYSCHVDEMNMALDNNGSFNWNSEHLIKTEPFNHDIEFIITGNNGKILINEVSHSTEREMQSYQISSVRTDQK